MIAMIKGQVSGMQQRTEPRDQGTPILVWDYRIERKDETGNPLPRVPVEMRGTSFDGGLSTGDWVEIEGEWQAGETLRPRSIRNLSTGALVTAIGLSSAPEDGARRAAVPDSANAVIVGQARRIQQRTQFINGESVIFVDFRLESADAPPVSVEMRGRMLSGIIGEGDCIELRSKVGAGGMVETDRVFDRTTGCEVVMDRGVSASWQVAKAVSGERMAVVQYVFGAAVLVAILGVFVFLGVTAFHDFHTGQ